MLFEVFIFGSVKFAKRVEADFFEQETQTRLVAVVAVAALVEDALDGFGDEIDFARGDEFFEEIGDAAARAHAAADIDRESERAFAFFRDESDVGDRCARAGVRASAEIDFEFSREAEAARVAQHLFGERDGIGGGVEKLARTDAGVLADGDVAHGVAAAAFGGKLDLVEFFDGGAEVVEKHLVDLDVLARGDVEDSVAVFARHRGESAHLVGKHATASETDAKHVGSVLALFVDSERNADGAEIVGREDAEFEAFDFLSEPHEVLLEVFRQAHNGLHEARFLFSAESKGGCEEFLRNIQELISRGGG